jgi:uncharacterized protein (DUF302 family)
MSGFATMYFLMLSISKLRGQKMKIILPIIVILVFLSSAVSADNGLISLKSTFSVMTTADRLEQKLKAKGMTVFARINHSASASEVGENLRPTELVIFGNPKVGTPLMQCGQTVAIDLPQKSLVWEDEKGQVWLSYNDPKYIAKRHNIIHCDQVLTKITNALSNFAKAATAD